MNRRGPDPDELEIERRWLLKAKIDTADFEFFYLKYNVPISNYIHSRVLDPDLTEDLVSRTFFLAMHKIWQFKFQGVTFGAWLFRIAGNLVRQHWRRSSYWKYDSGYDLEERPDGRTGQLGEMIVSEEQMRIHRCLRRLKEIDQDIIVLHYWEGLTLVQIAAILGMKVGTVKARIFRARIRLEEMLGEEGDDEDGQQAKLPPGGGKSPPILHVLHGATLPGDDPDEEDPEDS